MKRFSSLCSLKGMLETLSDMNIKLEEIQKSLDMYLETKRQIFPRFYFLSNDDLLEILGQSKNPQAVSIIVCIEIYVYLPSLIVQADTEFVVYVSYYQTRHFLSYLYQEVFCCIAIRLLN